MSNKYNNSKIYAIRNNIDDDVYIGSTTMPLSKRMVKHRCSANTCPDKMIITTKMNELGIDNFYIELVEELYCENIEQLRKREGEIIRDMGTLNTRVNVELKKNIIKILLKKIDFLTKDGLIQETLLRLMQMAL